MNFDDLVEPDCAVQTSHVKCYLAKRFGCTLSLQELEDVTAKILFEGQNSSSSAERPWLAGDDTAIFLDYIHHHI